MNEAALAALRAQGAHLQDPVRFRYLEALSARMRSQPASVQQVLQGKFDEAVADYHSRVPALAQDSAQVMPHAAEAARLSPLARLNHAIAERTKDSADDARTRGIDRLDGGLDVPSGMKSVRRFAEVWSRIATDQQLAQALTRGPETAGPLNSHNLMLRAMSLMHGLSPDYLRRFLAQADALLLLDQMNQRNALKDGKKARPGRGKP